MNRAFTLLSWLCFFAVTPLFSQNKETSVLSNGIIHRIAVQSNGVYKLDYNFIRDQLKIDPASLAPNQITIYGNGSGRIPQWSRAPRIDDLEQTATIGIGLADGQFNSGDYLLWYAEGPERWTFDTTAQVYRMEKNIYDDRNHYYVIINGPSRINMETRANGGQGDYISDASLTYQRLEEEKVNLLGRFRPPGSGQEWYGDEMSVLKVLDYSSRFDLADLVPTDTFQFTARFAVRADNATRFYIHFNTFEFSRNVGGVSLGNFEASYANDGIIQTSFVPGESITHIDVNYPQANGVNSRAWLDFLEINAWKENKYRTGKPVLLSDPRLRYRGIPTYRITGFPASGQIWDISNPIQPVVQQYTVNGSAEFTFAGNGLATPPVFICFNPETDLLVPTYEAAVPNQNLHSLQQTDLLIIYYDEFEAAAMALAEHRRSHSHLTVEAVSASKVYNEFGGGSKDPAAIRDFARMLYKRDIGFQYLLLIGDATYDFLNHAPDVPYQNFIPAFETEESLDPIRSFPSDDFFALLDDDEGDNLIGAIDIAVGRFPVSTADEAMEIVDKIIHYDTHPSVLSDWKNRVVMVADDEDSNVHLDQADKLAVKTNTKHPVLNEQKIYLDAYPQQSTPGGDRYPDVNQDIDLNMQKGALTVTYLGHGGPNGWTQERVLGINQAQSYVNLNNLPLFITATCSFAGYDEPGFTSTGEHLLINPNGGAIALMTTVRAVFSGSNERLTDEVLSILYTPDGPGVYPTIGEVLRRAKNGNAIDTLDNNARKFTMLGDPSLQLAIPRYKIAVTEIQGSPVNPSIPDTLSALEKTVLRGQILNDQDELLPSFNGRLYLTLYDKVQVRHTLANDESSAERNFATQTRQLFKGTASVVNGEWTIEFVLPKDIDFSYGNGKMSFYAEDGETDASGYFSGFIIGGVSEGGLSDDEPPVIELYMNNEHFKSGGITDASPDIYAVLMDDNGINVSGTSVGHDIEAILDEDDRNSLILNDFYQAALDDYTHGVVRYPLNDLTPGKHTLSMTAWDLANNVASASLEFVVVENEGALLTHVLNFPNPFRDFTHISFEHNRPDATLEFTVDIFALNGGHVKTIRREGYIPGGYRVEDIEWKGETESGAALGPGIYLYRIKAVFTTGDRVEVVDSEPGKLVIVR